MSNSLDPSPRSAKRRKVANYGSTKSTLSTDHVEITPPTSQSTFTKRRSSRTKPTLQDIIDNDHDSAYGSKDDSLIEGEQEEIDVDKRFCERRQTAGLAARTSTTEVTQSYDDPDSTSSSKNGSSRAKKRRTQNETYLNVEDAEEVYTGFDSQRQNSETQQQDAMDQETEESASIYNRSSSRARRKPRRFSNTEAKEIQQKPDTPSKSKSARVSYKQKVNLTPKGILTPSKRQRTGPRKSVAFDEDGEELGNQLGFKDISTSVKKKRTEGRDDIQLDLAHNSTSTDLDMIDVSISETIFESNLEVEDLLDDVEDDLASQQLQSGLALGTKAIADAPELLNIKREILTRIVSFKDGPLTHLESQYDAIYNLLSATVNEGESNSMLLLGARGVGKSLLLETALKNLQSESKDDFHTVRLNGFFQTDDKLALREIWRQLGREMHVSEEETGEVSSYADIMASLLTLLSHPEEADASMSHSADEHRTSKSVIIIMDEFELFTGHPRQTLLYNLFDIAQSRKAPIAVIGCSTRMDVVDCLEKRVKSRYSHRWLFVPSAKSYPAFEDSIRNSLLMGNKSDNLQFSANKDLVWRSMWNEFITTSFMPNKSIQLLLKQTFYTNKSVPDALTAIYPILATLPLHHTDRCLSISSSTSIDEMTTLLNTVSTEPSLLTLLTNIPPLHIALLAASARLETIHHLTSINFNLVYSHYSELIQRSRLQASAGGSVAVGPSLRLWGRSTCRGVWEELWQRGFLVPVTIKEDGEMGGTAGSIGAGAGSGDGGSSRMFKVDVTLEEVEWAVKERRGEGSIAVGMGGMAEIVGKWCREI